MVAPTRLRVRFYAKYLSYFSTNLFSETQLKRRPRLQTVHLKRQSLNIYLYVKCFAKKLQGKNKKNVLYPILFSARDTQTEDSQRARVVMQRKPILLG
jgi:hypothetical protein